MNENKPDIEPDFKTAVDRGEPLSQMEPLLIAADSRHRDELTDLAFELAQQAAGFRHSLPAGIQSSLADLIRSMNCYYSNLIEGHYTHPIDIEHALNNQYSDDPEKRNLQHEAAAHIHVQNWIDKDGLLGRTTAVEGLCEIHRRFGELLPEALLWTEDAETGERLKAIPGELRRRDVRVGQHVPISPGAVPRFLARFENVYHPLAKLESILASAAAHHRLLWIHPFLDGNGRVARLMSHATLLEKLDTGGIWSVARGLARNARTYKKLLAECDQSRRNDLDGRGHLSEEALARFTRFFLDTCLDQVKFMKNLVQPDRLGHRIRSWAEEEIRAGTLPPKAGKVLEAVLYRGQLNRGEVPEILGVGARQARRVISSLIDQGVLASKSSRAPLHLAFPARLAPRWMPGLFPEP